MSSCFWGHTWSKWEQYKWAGMTYPAWSAGAGIETSETRQRRTCLVCGKMQDQWIKHG